MIYVWHLSNSVGSLCFVGAFIRGALCCKSSRTWFFVLSGYLMTYIMVNTYGYDSKGMGKFALNRFLRLYPAYMFVLFLSVTTIILMDGMIEIYKPAMFLPRSLHEIIENISMIYFSFSPITVEPRLSPPTWALTLELIYYCLICLGLSKTRKITLIWVALSVCYTLFTLYKGYGKEYRYAMMLSGSLPFSLGALLYHYKEGFLGLLKHLPSVLLNPWFAMTVFVLNTVSRVYIPGMWWLGFYTNLLVAVYIVLILSEKNIPGVSSRLDYKVGELSYHIYLLHWLVAAVIAGKLFGIEVFVVNHWVTALTLVATIFISVFISKVVDAPVNYLRKKVREG
ncbi:acyltransferase family protein [Dasania marina]|uniref:acyltransferase family protein n=1 Tax=Dasania marina TaxID=471499 RepID=UPI0004B23268|nr:acyltransferase [Dasania marina]